MNLRAKTQTNRHFQIEIFNGLSMKNYLLKSVFNNILIKILWSRPFKNINFAGKIKYEYIQTAGKQKETHLGPMVVFTTIDPGNNIPRLVTFIWNILYIRIFHCTS